MMSMVLATYNWRAREASETLSGDVLSRFVVYVCIFSTCDLLFCTSV